MCGSDNPGAIAECFVDCLAETNRHILCSVMIVDMEVAGRFDCYVKLTVFGKECQHVIEKADAGIGLAATGAVDGQGERNRCLAGGAIDSCLACLHMILVLVD